MAKKKLKVARRNPKKEISVMAWIENGNGSVLLVRQAAGRKLWTLPGGKVKAREGLRSALVREVWEETKLKVEANEFLDLMDRPERGAVMFLFGVRTIKHGSLPKLPTREIIDLRFVTRMPKSVTPSAAYFWQRKQQGLRMNSTVD